MNPGDKSNDLPTKMYVRKPFAFADRNFKIGEVFDQGSIPPRRVRQLWDQRKLGTETELKRDQDRHIARLGVEASAKTSMGVAEPAAPIEEPVTAEDYDL